MLSVNLGNTQQDYLIIEVSDNGCGMDEKTREKIFDPFFTTKRGTKGSGLGLFVSKNLIEDLDGLIEAESKVGKGSTLRVTLAREYS
jgi:signal transduction histidine kinase